MKIAWLGEDFILIEREFHKLEVLRRKTVKGRIFF